MTLLEMRRWTIVICAAVTVLLTVWDIIAFAFDQSDNNPTISNVMRTLNGDCGGLIALATIGLWIHIFLFQFLPSQWQGE